jgi:hypothetical protein
MKRFLYKIGLFLMMFIIIVLLGAKYLSVKVEERDFKNSETESDLLVYRANTHYDLALTGISHARNFSRYGNHERVEEVLGKKVLNLGKGSGTCGVKDQYFYLKYIYEQNVSIDTVVHVISPPYLFGKHLDIDASAFMDEPFRFDFFYKYIVSSSENKFEKLFHYVRSKYQKAWMEYKPFSIDSRNDSLLQIDNRSIEQGMKLAFKDEEVKGKDEELIFDDNVTFLRKIIELVERNNGVSIFIITPTLFGDWPNTDRMLVACKVLEKEFGVKTYNFSSVIKKPAMFYDHHHLNTKGVVYFTENFLKPIFEH